MGESGQLHAPVTLLPGKAPPVSSEYETGWVPASVWTFYRIENLFPCWESNHFLAFPAPTLVTIPIMLSGTISIYTHTPKPCFTPVSFVPFCFKAPCLFISFLNLRPQIFGLTLFGWFISICLSRFFLWEYHS